MSRLTFIGIPILNLFRWALLASTLNANTPLGHLPAEVSKWLAPLLAGGFIALNGVVMEDPASAKAPVLISITVCGNSPQQMHALCTPIAQCT